MLFLRILLANVQCAHDYDVRYHIFCVCRLSELDTVLAKNVCSNPDFILFKYSL